MASSSSSSSSSSSLEMHYEYDRRRCVLLWKEDAVNALEYYGTEESVAPTELMFGTLQVRDAPSVQHQEAVGAFFVALRDHVRAHRLGRVFVAPLDVVLDEARALIVQPDLLYVANERRGIIGRRVYGAPDLVVEVLSPNPRVGDLERRLGWFANYGVQECWAYHQTIQRLEIVSFAAGTIDRRLWIDRDDPIQSPVLPGFSPALRDVLDR
jgi:Uma2 family endonuclease